jgi:hypothetical protein
MPSPSNGVRAAPPSITIPVLDTHSTATMLGKGNLKGRGRSGSIVKVEEVAETVDDVLDQSIYRNMNTEWVNRKGGFTFCIFLLRDN